MKLNKQIQLISTSKLTGKADFQRPVDPRRVARIAKDFDPKKMKPIQVANIEGMGLIIWDGQHTAAAARVANGNEDLQVPCIVDNLTYEEAAELVANQNKNKRNLNSIEQFTASVESADPDDTNIMRVLKQHKIKLDTVCSENSTSAVTALRQIYAFSCPDLDNTLHLIEMAWPCDPNRYRGDVIMAVGKMRHIYEGKFKDKDMWEKLGFKPLKTYIGNAKYGEVGKTIQTKLIEQFIVDYNKNRRKNRLNLQELYK